MTNLAQMTDYEAIQQALNLYSSGCSQRDWPLVMGLFLPDGVWEVTGQEPVVGHAAMEAAMAGFLTRLDYFVQINSPATIRIDGDRAVAQTTIRECGKIKDRDEALEVMGFYTDDLVRTPEGWKFAKKLFRGAGMHRFPLCPGPALAFFAED